MPAKKSCPLSGRCDHGHFFSEYTYLPDSDRHYMARAIQIIAVLDDIDSDHDREEECTTNVFRELDVAILAGAPFMEANDVSVSPAK